MAARCTMMSGRPATMSAAMPGSERSAPGVAALPQKPFGLSGVIISTRLNWSMPWEPMLASGTRRSVSLRPTMPAAPIMSICMRWSLWWENEAPIGAQSGPSLKSISGGESAIDDKNGAGHIETVVAGKEEDGAGDVLGYSRTPQRHAPIFEIDVLEPVGLVLMRGALLLLGHARVDIAGRHRIGPDAEWPEIDRHAAGEVDHPTLGGRIGHGMRLTANALHRGDIDDAA